MKMTLWVRILECLGVPVVLVCNSRLDSTRFFKCPAPEDLYLPNADKNSPRSHPPPTSPSPGASDRRLMPEPHSSWFSLSPEHHPMRLHQTPEISQERPPKVAST